MTEIVAAHLERVAGRERLAQQWAQSWLDTQSKAPGINLGEMEQSLAGMLLRWGAQYAKEESAAALAACAREEAKWRLNHWPPLGALITVDSLKSWIRERQEEQIERVAALERAAGESSLDPKSGQHDS